MQENPGFAGFLTDDDYRVRFALNITPDAGQELLKPAAGGKWEPMIKIGPLDAMTTSPAGFDKTGEKLYFIDSRDRNTAALTTIDLKTGKQTLLAEDPRADISGALTHPTEKTIQAVSFTYARTEWKILDEAIQAGPRLSQDRGRRRDSDHQPHARRQAWTVAYLMDNGPVRFYLYDRQPERKATFLFTSNRELEKLPLVKMHPQVIKSRDGLELVSYLTLPSGPIPTATAGPTSRCRWC